MMQDAGIQWTLAQVNEVMVTAALGGKWEDALRVYNDAQDAGMSPDIFTYNALLMAYSAGKVCSRREGVGPDCARCGYRICALFVE
jgi:pentatricopeptide repeat protein